MAKQPGEVGPVQKLQGENEARAWASSWQSLAHGNPVRIIARLFLAVSLAIHYLVSMIERVYTSVVYRSTRDDYRSVCLSATCVADDVLIRGLQEGGAAGPEDAGSSSGAAAPAAGGLQRPWAGPEQAAAVGLAAARARARRGRPPAQAAAAAHGRRRTGRRARGAAPPGPGWLRAASVASWLLPREAGRDRGVFGGGS